MKIDKMPADALAEMHGYLEREPDAPEPGTHTVAAVRERIEKAPEEPLPALAGRTLLAEIDRLTAELAEAWRIYGEDRDESVEMQKASHERAHSAIETIKTEALRTMREQDRRLAIMDREIEDAITTLAEVKSKLEDARQGRVHLPPVEANERLAHLERLGLEAFDRATDAPFTKAIMDTVRARFAAQLRERMAQAAMAWTLEADEAEKDENAEWGEG